MLRALYLRGREVGASEGASELEGYTPQGERRVLELLGSEEEDELYVEIPLLGGSPDPDDRKSQNDTTDTDDVAVMALREAGRQAYDGIAASATVVRAYNEGYDDGVREGVMQAAKRMLSSPRP